MYCQSSQTNTLYDFLNYFSITWIVAAKLQSVVCDLMFISNVVYVIGKYRALKKRYIFEMFFKFFRKSGDDNISVRDIQFNVYFKCSLCYW